MVNYVRSIILGHVKWRISGRTSMYDGTEISIRFFTKLFDQKYEERSIQNITQVE